MPGCGLGLDEVQATTVIVIRQGADTTKPNVVNRFRTGAIMRSPHEESHRAKPPGHAADTVRSAYDVQADRYGPDVDDDGPIELYGFHPEYDTILARRSGEPSFMWVQDLEDAYQAAASRGGVDVVVSREFRDELLARGESPLEVQGLRII